MQSRMVRNTLTCTCLDLDAKQPPYYYNFLEYDYFLPIKERYGQVLFPNQLTFPVP